MEEIFLTELVVQGALEDLEPAELYGVMCAMVQSLPRTARVRHGEDKWRAIGQRIFAISESEIVQGATALTDQEITFTPELMPLGERWAQGESLEDLMGQINNPTDLSGDLVGGLRRAKDMISQLRHVQREDPDRRRELGALMRRVSRDEVEVVY